jgi:hypothetical protein
LLAEGVVRTLGAVKDQPVGQFAVKERKVGEEQLLVVVDEGLLDRSIESLGMGVHLRVFWVGVPALDALIFEEACEVSFELTAVVGENDLRGVGQQEQSRFEGAGGVLGLDFLGLTCRCRGFRCPRLSMRLGTCRILSGALSIQREGTCRKQRTGRGVMRDAVFWVSESMTWHQGGLPAKWVESR